MREKLLKRLGLAATATDEEIENTIGALQTKTAANETQIGSLTIDLTTERGKVTTLTTQLTAANTTATTAQTESVNERQRSRDLLIAQGVRDGKILISEQADWKTKFDTKFTEAVNELQAAKPKLNTKNKVAGLGPRNANLATERGRQITDAVNERRQKFTSESYDQSFAQVKREKPELFTEATQTT